nr:MAG TPA: hypothetical protein [Caudoviricetes sp.]
MARRTPTNHIKWKHVVFVYFCNISNIEFRIYSMNGTIRFGSKFIYLTKIDQFPTLN